MCSVYPYGAVISKPKQEKIRGDFDGNSKTATHRDIKDEVRRKKCPKPVSTSHVKKHTLKLNVTHVKRLFLNERARNNILEQI